MDPKSAESIHYRNVKRVVRALEYYKQTGNRISEHNEEQRKKDSPYNYKYFVLNDIRDNLYERINKRVDIMFDDGLIDEMQLLTQIGISRDNTSMQGIGYKEILDYWDTLGEPYGSTIDENGIALLKEQIKGDTRHLQKDSLRGSGEKKLLTGLILTNMIMIALKLWIICLISLKIVVLLSNAKLTIREKDNEGNVLRTAGIDEAVYNYGNNVLENLKERFEAIDEVAEYNQLKVIAAMQKNRVAEMHLSGTSGYGYNDEGRDTLERVYADIFKTEDALVRPQIICGTHALNVAISSNLRPGDELLSPVGKPYDTMDEIIGIRPSKGSLAEYNISYRQVDLLDDGSFDYDGIRKAINEKTKLVTIQRSKGYATRPTLSVERIGELIHFIKDIKPDVICMVDNCYGEFVEKIEPSEVGADMVVGSLIKNPGGGLAPCGGYIAGRKDCIEQAAYRLSSPGLGKEVGATIGVNKDFYQGLFLAPTVVAGALKALYLQQMYMKRLDLSASLMPQRKDMTLFRQLS